MRIGIVDDHPLFRLGLRQALDREVDIDVLWDVGSVGEARPLIGGMPVDVILMDVRLGDDTGGLEATHAITREKPQIKVVMISALLDEHVVRAARRAGAVGYLAKDIRPEQLARALRALTSLSGPVVPRAVNLGTRLPSSRVGRVNQSQPKGRQELLSRREMEVLSGIRAGRTNREIADQLGISPTTVNKHVHKILQKLGVRNRAHAATRIPFTLGLPSEPVDPAPMVGAIGRLPNKSRRSPASAS